VAIAVVVGLTLVGTPYALLQTTVGQVWAGKLATHFLAGPGSKNFRIDWLAVVAAGRIDLTGVALVDQRGDWLVAPRVTVDWLPWRLLRGRFAIEAVNAGLVDVRRRPEERARLTTTPAPLLADLPSNIGAVSIDVLHLNETVVGVDANFQVQGRGPIAAADSVGVDFVFDRLDRTGDSITFSSRFSPADRRMEVRLVAHEARGGVLARALGISAADDLAIELRGTGPIDGWSGSLESRVGGEPVAHATIALQGVTGSALHYRIEGRLDVTRLGSKRLPTVLRSPTEFRVEGQWRREANRLEVDVARVTNTAGTIDLDGRIELDTSLVAGTARLEIRDGSWIGKLTDDAIQVERVSAETSFQGPLLGPDLHGVATVSGLRSSYVGASSARLSLDLKGTEGGAGPRRRFDAKLTSRALDYPDLMLASLIGAQADLGLGGNVDLATGRLVGLKGRLRGASLILAISEGTVDPAAPAANFAIEANVTDLARLDDWVGAHLSGSMKTAGRLVFSASGFTATVSAQATEVGTGMASLDALLGPSVTFEGVAESLPDGPVVIRDLKLSGRSLVVGGGAKFETRGRTVTADYTIEIADLATLSAFVGTALRIRRPRDRPEISGIRAPASRSLHRLFRW
jgi:translocation and assembly module TamB